MPLPASLANLTRAGGDRFEDRRAMIAIIREALRVSLLDAEIRRYFRLQDGEPVTEAKRRRMARQKAPRVWQAMVNAWLIAAGEPLKKLVQQPDGSFRKRRGGLNFGGIMRIGRAPPVDLAIRATDEFGVSLASRGIEIYQKPVQGSGYRRYPLWANLPGFWPVGSPDVIAANGYAYVIIAGNAERVVFQRDGTKGADDIYRAWFYVDPGQGEKRVRWKKLAGQASGVMRLKTEILDTFWCELNGVTP